LTGPVATPASPLRVLRLYHSGVVTEYRQRERALRALGHDVHLVCPPAWSEGGSMVRAESGGDVPVHVVGVYGPRHPILFWYSPRALRCIVRELQPQIVDLHEEPYSLAVTSALRVIRAEAPAAQICIYSAQNIMKRYPRPFRRFERRALARASAAYPCSTEAGDVLREKGFTGDVHVLPLGVTLPASAPPERHPLVVGFLGRIEPYKGGHIALDAFAAASAGLDVRLEFVGAGSQQAGLEKRAAALGVGERVTFLGAVPQADALDRIGGYAVVVMPSLTTPTWKEQFGRVAVQAMAAGTPVIASDSGSLREVVGPAGVLVREGDTQAWAHELRSLLSDPDRRAELGRLGRRRAAVTFTWDEIARRGEQMYRDMLS
jgi:glycosyltransferase involved in cell wall biosynthesis